MPLEIRGIEEFNSLNSSYLLPLYYVLSCDEEPKQDLEEIRVEVERLKGGIDYFQHYHS